MHDIWLRYHAIVSHCERLLDTQEVQMGDLKKKGEKKKEKGGAIYRARRYIYLLFYFNLSKNA